MSARFDRRIHLMKITLAIFFIGQEMKDGTVVPEVKILLGILAEMTGCFFYAALIGQPGKQKNKWS